MRSDGSNSPPGKYENAKRSYERVLQINPSHSKVLQQLGWLYHHNPSWGDQQLAISYLMRSIEADQNDGQTWYLLGRCYMGQQQFQKAYDAYQRAVLKDSQNPTFWCSIGVLYYQINQFSDALDAYTRAIKLNPHLSEVWYDLGTLYESCKQISDSLDAYTKASELDPSNEHIKERLTMLRAQHLNPSVPFPSSLSVSSNIHSLVVGRP
jgi:cytochrome c-type biogenesis protein CcmH/NrfG